MGEPTRRKRFRWTKRIYAAVALFLLVSAGGWVYWNHVAEARLAAAVAEIRARGEPLAWSELAPEPLPPDQDAAVLYRQAGHATALIGPDDAEPIWRWREKLTPRLLRLKTMLRSLVDDAQFRAEHAQDVRAILAESRNALALCRRARSLRAADWGMDYDGFTGGGWKTSGNMDALGDVLHIAAMAAHERGHDGEAVAYLRDTAALANKLGSYPDLALGYGTGNRLRQDIARAVEQMSHTVRVGSDPASATPAQVRALLSELREERPLRRGLATGVLARRAWFFEFAQRRRRGGLPRGRSRWLTTSMPNVLALRVGPDAMWKLDEARILYEHGCLLRAARADSHPAFLHSPARREAEAYAAEFKDQGAVQAFTRPLSSRSACCTRAKFRMRWHWAVIAEERMAVAALAIRLYELDHGRRPKTLAELVPGYLSAVPDDPFAEVGTKLIYPPAGSPPVVYSRSEDGRDDGGTWSIPPGHRDADLPFFVDGDRPRDPCHWQDPTAQAP